MHKICLYVQALKTQQTPSVTVLFDPESHHEEKYTHLALKPVEPEVEEPTPAEPVPAELKPEEKK